MLEIGDQIMLRCLSTLHGEWGLVMIIFSYIRDNIKTSGKFPCGLYWIAKVTKQSIRGGGP